MLPATRFYYNTFQNAWMNGLTTSLSGGAISGALLLNSGGTAAAVAAGVTAAGGAALGGAATWLMGPTPADRLYRIVNGQQEPRIIARNMASVGHYETVQYDSKNDGKQLANIHYFESGEENKTNGTIVMVPGFGSNAYQFGRVFDELAERYHVIVVDLPGHGYSSDLINDDYDFLEHILPILNAFLDSKGLKDVTLVGSSMGGGVSHLLASQNPRIKKVILMCSSGCTNTVEHVSMFIDAAANVGRIAPILARLSLLDYLGTFDTLNRYVNPTSHTLCAHDVAQFAAPYKGNPGKIRARAAYGASIARLTRDLEEQKPLLAVQDKMDKPALIVNAEADPTIPVAVPRALNKMFHNARSLWIPRDQFPAVGHTPMSEMPELALAIIAAVMEGEIDLSRESVAEHLSVAIDKQGSFRFWRDKTVDRLLA